MKNNYNHILFDLDGTLTDSAEGVTRSVQYALRQYNIDAALEELRSFIGPPLHQSFIEVYGFSKQEAYRAVEYYRDYYRDMGIFENEVYPGIPELLDNLYQSRKKIYLATSKPVFFAEKILSYFKLDHYFTTIAGSNLDGSRVEKQEVIAHVLENNKMLNIDETVMVGDRKHDIIGARTWNLNSIGVTYGYGSLEELQEAAPTLQATSVPELQELLLS
ncbi:MAG: HAD family hydrolase [Bacillota bacterium]